MAITVDELLGKSDLRLRLCDDARFASEACRLRRAARIEWAHNSDLLDPSEFVAPGTLLLTDGGQFDATGSGSASYVARLIEARVVGLGFATGIIHPSIPLALVEACAARGFPLLEVRDRVPFIAVIRRIADALADERAADLERTAAAQRAISVAALRVDGMPAIVRELEAQLECRAVLFDSGGRRIGTVDAVAARRGAAAIEHEVAATLQRGNRAAIRIAGDPDVTVHTLGATGALRGALAIEHGRPLSRTAEQLVTSVVGLATIALEQRHALDEARAALASAVLELLLKGEHVRAAAVAAPVWRGLPAEPVLVQVVDAGAAVAALDVALDGLGVQAEGGVFHARRGGRTIVVTERSRGEAVAALAAQLGCTVGEAEPSSFASLATALDEASVALSHAVRGGDARVRFAAIAEHGVLALLQSERAALVAARVLAPLLGTDARDHAPLLAALETWLRLDCSWQQAAAQLGIHRHTLRNRIEAAGRILCLDLETFEGRLEAWTALRLLAGGQGPVARA